MTAAAADGGAGAGLAGEHLEVLPLGVPVIGDAAHAAAHHQRADMHPRVHAVRHVDGRGHVLGGDRGIRSGQRFGDNHRGHTLDPADRGQFLRRGQVAEIHHCLAAHHAAVSGRPALGHRVLPATLPPLAVDQPPPPGRDSVQTMLEHREAALASRG
jgi:hypothetical protein